MLVILITHPKKSPGHLKLADQLCFLEVGRNVKLGAVNQIKKDCHDGNGVYEVVQKGMYMIPKAWTKGYQPQKVNTHPLTLQGQMLISNWLNVVFGLEYSLKGCFFREKKAAQRLEGRFGVFRDELVCKLVQYLCII